MVPMKELSNYGEHGVFEVSSSHGVAEAKFTQKEGPPETVMLGVQKLCERLAI